MLIPVTEATFKSHSINRQKQYVLSNPKWFVIAKILHLSLDFSFAIDGENIRLKIANASLPSGCQSFQHQDV